MSKNYFIISNNKNNGKQKYSGVGGHLFAIAIKKSREWGHDGCVYGFAANQDLLKHYVKDLGAEWIGMLHPNHFMIADEVASNIEEVYDYDWECEK